MAMRRVGTAGEERSGRALGYMPGLDGIRALAVLAVIVYHSGFSWLPGGFYGVDAFFALSGYLITSLLLTEWKASDTVTLRSFWARRARRLLPGLFLMLAGIGVLSTLWPHTLDTPYLRLDTLSTLFYVANWHFILDHANYFFVTSQPSPLLHTWSLAIEEQFYILWPLAVLGILARGKAARRTRLVRLLWLSVIGALASAAWMAILANATGDLTRAYYGTDTRAQRLLVGAALAVALALWKPAEHRSGRLALGLAGAAGAAGCALMWGLVPETSSFAYRGGFLVAALSATGIVACASQVGASPVTRALATWPLRSLGKISYGVYLWYWPTILVVDFEHTHLTGYELLALRLGVVIAVASLSYHLVESPLRRASFASWRARLALPAGALACVASVFTATALLASSPVAALAPLGASLESTSVHLPLSVRLAASPGAPASGRRSSGASAGVPSATSTGASSGAPPATQGAATSSGASAGSSAGAGAGSSPTGRATRPVEVLLVGDSMAGTLGVGMQQVQSRYGVQVVNEGHPGCSLGDGSAFKVLWYTAPPGKPCGAGGTARTLLATWKHWVDVLNPAVSLYLARTDLFDQYVDGAWQHVGQPAYDRLLAGRLQQAINVLSSRGGRVVLATDPYFASGLQPSGQGWPEDNPARVVAYNRLLSQVAARNKATTTVLDVGSLLSPQGKFQTFVDGVPARCTDGVHISVSGGQLIGEKILPELRSIGQAHASASPGGSWPGYSVSAPPWFAKLPCGA